MYEKTVTGQRSLPRFLKGFYSPDDLDRFYEDWYEGDDPTGGLTMARRRPRQPFLPTGYMAVAA